MGKKYIPDYSKYSAYQLVDIYFRIDREMNPENFALIKKEIKSKLGLPDNADLDTPAIQNKLNKILEMGEANKQNGNKRYWLDSIPLYLSFLILILLALFSVSSGIILALMVATYTISALMISFLTDRICFERFTISKEDKPYLFEILQISYALVSIIFIFFILFSRLII